MFENFHGKVVHLDRKINRKSRPVVSVEIGDKRYVKVPFERPTNALLSFTAFPRETLFSKIFFKRKERFPFFLARNVILDKDEYYKEGQMYQGAVRKGELLTAFWLKDAFLEPSVFSKLAFFGTGESLERMDFYRKRVEFIASQFEQTQWFYKFVAQYMDFEKKKTKFLELKKQARKLRKRFNERFPKQPKLHGRPINYSYLRKLWRNRNKPKYEDINYINFPFSVKKNIFQKGKPVEVIEAEAAEGEKNSLEEEPELASKKY